MKRRHVLFLFLLFVAIVSVLNATNQPEGKYIGAGEIVKIHTNAVEINDGEKNKTFVLTKKKKKEKLRIGDQVEAWGYKWDSQEEIYGATYVRKEKGRL